MQPERQTRAERVARREETESAEDDNLCGDELLLICGGRRYGWT